MPRSKNITKNVSFKRCKLAEVFNYIIELKPATQIEYYVPMSR
jgi:hypothetical protein